MSLEVPGSGNVPFSFRLPKEFLESPLDLFGILDVEQTGRRILSPMEYSPKCRTGDSSRWGFEVHVLDWTVEGTPFRVSLHSETTREFSPYSCTRVHSLTDRTWA